VPLTGFLELWLLASLIVFSRCRLSSERIDRV
jgi:hypothetical protein